MSKPQATHDEKFAIDPELSAVENLRRFYEHLSASNPEYSRLLESAVASMLPLPESGSERSSKRVAVNRQIAAKLDESSSNLKKQ